ncbi:MAG: hypothetical protein FWG91_12600 [Lachnospiraceae bacterium]|nr:hypothetical protein [Lachnospiraceae bacterium]
MKNKKLTVIVIVAVMVVAAIIAIIAAVLTRQGMPLSSGVFVNQNFRVADDTWRLTAVRASGNSRINYSFTEANLAAMNVNSTNSGGNITLTFIQGDTERSYDISGAFTDRINMSDFKPGKIRLRLDFADADNLDIEINWR